MAESAELEHVEKRRYRCHRQWCDFHIVNEEYVGPRGGRKIPIDILWKPSGTGLFTSVFHICGCAILYPHVRYHNGDGKPRTMFAIDWVEMTGKGHFRWPNDEEKAERDALLKACDKEKSFYGSRVAEIVTSIVENGGTVSITSR